MARLNPNPRIEKLKDFRNSEGWNSNPRCVKSCVRLANKAYRHRWKCKKWHWEDEEDLSFSSYNPRHWVLWDLS